MSMIFIPFFCLLSTRLKGPPWLHAEFSRFSPQLTYSFVLSISPGPMGVTAFSALPPTVTCAPQVRCVMQMELCM